MRLNSSVMRRHNPLTTLLGLVAFAAGAQTWTALCGQAVPVAAVPNKATVSGPQTPVEQAKSLSRKGQFAAAERELRAYLTVHPGDSVALYELGSVLHRENQPKDSLAAYTEAAKGKSPSAEDLRVVALDYVLLDDYPDAVHWLERAVAEEPANAEAWYDLGRAHMMQDDFPDAEGALKRSLALIHEPMGSVGAVKAENNLGVTYEGEGRTSEAANAYRIAIGWQHSLPKPSEQPLLNYGKLLIDQNRATNALAPLEQAVRIAPSDPKCHEQLSRALDRQSSETHSNESADRAQAEMLEAIRLDPSNARLHFQLGLMYRRAGKTELAREQMALSGALYGSHSTASDH